MVEVLAAALTGAHFAFEASSFLLAEGPPPAVGQFLVAIDPGAFAGEKEFSERMVALVQAIDGEGVRLPGSRRLALRERAERLGVAVDAKLYAEVAAIARHARD